MAFLKVLVCALSLSLALSQVTFSASTPIQNPTGTATITQNSGYIVTMNNAGWVVGDALTLTTTAVTVVSTLLATPTGATGVGLVAVGGNGGNTAGTSSAAIACAPATAFTGLSNLEGKGPTGYPSTSYPTSTTAANTQCPVDFVTLYSATPTTAQATAATGVTQTTAKLLVGVPVTWSITQTAAAASGGTQSCNVVTVTTAGSSTITLNSAGACGSGAEKYFISAIPGAASTTYYTYSFYVNAEASGSKVCFQSVTQYQTTPACGYFTASGSSKSSNILAVLGAPLLFVLAALLN